MRTPLWKGLHLALNSPRVFGLAALGLLLEVLIRFGLAVTVHPILLVVWPPVVALPLLGAGAPAVRERLNSPAEPPALNLGSTLREVGPGLLVIAVVGHLVALVLGSSAFLVVDTVVRFVVYALGGTVPFTIVLFLPLPGVAAGTLLAWGVFAPVVERFVAGERLRAAGSGTLRTLSDRRRAVGILFVHGGVVSVAAVVFAVFLRLANVHNMVRPTLGTQEASVFALGTVFGVVAAVLVLVGIFAYPIHVGLAAGSPDRPSAVPVGRIAVAGLLLSGLIVGTGVVRLTETRPLPADTAPAPLPEEATGAYAMAVERTLEVDHRFVVDDLRHDDRYTTVVVRSSRRVMFAVQNDGRTVEDTRAVYGDSSAIYPANQYLERYSLDERRVENLDYRPNSVASSMPGYWEITEEYPPTGGAFSLPKPATGEWETVRTENGIQTVELTNDAAVFDAIGAENVTAETAWIRMRIDRERGVVRGGRARLNGTVGDTNRIIGNYSFTVETGPAVDFDRPDALGPRSPGQWTWDLFAY